MTFTSPTPRPIALGALRRGDDLLVYQGQARTEARPYFRPLGGGIELGERAVDALHRELLEELGAALRDARLLGVLENIFDVDGRTGHEIAFVFDAHLVDESLYARDDLGVVLDEGSPVSWQPLSRFVEGRATLYPTGLLDLLC